MLGSSLMVNNGVNMQRALTAIGVAVAPRPMELVQRRHLSVSTAAFEGEAGPARTFTSYALYKGKGAAAFKAIPPSFKQLSMNTASSGAYTGYELDKEGVLLVEFANVIPSQGPQSGYGNRSYDWTKKVTFALKAIELAALTDLDNIPNPEEGVSFIHDPNKGSNNPNAVKTIKTLKFSLPAGSDSYLLSINQNLGAQKSFVTVPITRPEYVVLKQLASYMIPRMYGFDLLFEGQGAAPNNLASVGPEEN